MPSPCVRLGGLLFALLAPMAAQEAVAVPGLDAATALAFLRQHMPEADRTAVSDEFLRQEVQLALAARTAMPWGKELTDELFLHFVLPYAQANEARESWRADFATRCQPLVAGCKTPGEAALKLNATIFHLLNVHYSTQRQRADQAPSASIAQGKASCTGLSILLADACRACCIPARLVSVRWPHKAGNHTWVEVWDGAAWRFVGADEPDPAGFDHAWFVGDAAHCAAAPRENRLWAVSFAATGERFAAGWGRGVELHGIDVSARYAPTAVPQDPQQTADAAVLATMTRFFAATAEEQAKFEFDRNLDADLGTVPGDARLRALAAQAWRAAAHADLRADFAADIVRAGGKEAPYTKKQVGERGTHGFALVIAMHGGGGVRKEVNDSQWRVMQRYYKDHPEAGGYVYCALRAPTDEWNGFYTDYFYPLLERLIAQFVIAGDVDPDRVFAIGYSHGGYGAFAVGPKLPHRFAAVHASAAAPTDGETSAVGLHSLPFSFMVGEKDTAYGRKDRCEAFAKVVAELQAGGAYADVRFLYQPGFGHGGLPDRDILPELLKHQRRPVPAGLAWEQTDGVVTDHYWLRCPAPKQGARVDIVRKGDNLTITRRDAGPIELLLDARLLPTGMTWNAVVDGAAPRAITLQPSLRVLCETMLQRMDPSLAASSRVQLP
ncbi:MAG: hypothetical protein IPK26_23715 [Planctomycetes bacterium]|nr:hypothetical protein [Planctomycetota bacterium]